MDRISHAEAWLRGIGPYRKIGPMIEKMTLIEKLTNPAWRKSADSEWADLDVVQTVKTMREAAAEIARLRAALAIIADPNNVRLDAGVRSVANELQGVARAALEQGAHPSPEEAVPADGGPVIRKTLC